MKRNAFLIGLAIVCSCSPSSAQEFAPDMLFGSVITGELTDERTILYQGKRLRQTVRNISRVVISAGPTAEAIDKVTTTAEGLAAPVVRTYKTGKVPVGTPFKYRDGMMVFVFEGNQLRRLRTLGEGGRMHTYEFSAKDGVLSCKLSVGMLRENGNGQVKVESNQNWTTLSSQTTWSNCTVKKE